VINRLDQPVEGIVLFAKNAKVAAALTSQMKDGSMQKFYYAVVAGHMDMPEGTLIDYMEKDTRSNLSRVVSEASKNAKKAILSYEVKANLEKMQFLQIQLLTGRHHQIRVQFSHRKHPLIGDTKYGSAESISFSREIQARVPALCAFCLKWKHPVTKKELCVEIKPDNLLMQGMDNYK
jgi:23S rRNA pseudouridine1911/1915/1917 synthase